jgi:hypothetical protein
MAFARWGTEPTSVDPPPTLLGSDTRAGLAGTTLGQLTGRAADHAIAAKGFGRRRNRGDKPSIFIR